jgi:hypothetical protein
MGNEIPQIFSQWFFIGLALALPPWKKEKMLVEFFHVSQKNEAKQAFPRAAAKCPLRSNCPHEPWQNHPTQRHVFYLVIPSSSSNKLTYHLRSPLRHTSSCMRSCTGVRECLADSQDMNFLF